jgi:hypothetical protein
MRTTWGVDINQNNYKNIIDNDKKCGYSGYEIAFSYIDKDLLKNINDYLKEKQMCLIVQIHTDGNLYNSHTDSFFKQKKQLLKLISYDSRSPLKAINCHAGLDYWSIREKTKMFVTLNETNFERKNNLIISYETHRGRALNNPREYIDIIKEVKSQNDSALLTTLDLSHWILSYERLLDSKNLIFYDKLMKNIIHGSRIIHGRVGLENRIQVENPLLYESYFNYYKKIWKKIIEHNFIKYGETYMTIEYGPQPYSSTLQEQQFYLNNSELILDYYRKNLL